MSRYIDADAFEANMENEWERNEISNGEWIHFREMINAEPTADVAPVVHGRWEEKAVTDDPGAKVITEWQSCKCSSCGKYLTTPYLYYFTDYAYCPNCGASMMEGAEDDA